MWVPFVQKYSKNFQTLFIDAKMNHFRLCQTRCTVERWRYGLTSLSLTHYLSFQSGLIIQPNYSFSRFWRSCWNIICKEKIKCFFFLCQPRWMFSVFTVIWAKVRFFFHLEVINLWTFHGCMFWTSCWMCWRATAWPKGWTLADLMEPPKPKTASKLSKNSTDPLTSISAWCPPCKLKKIKTQRSLLVTILLHFLSAFYTKIFFVSTGQEDSVWTLWGPM